MMWGPWGGGWWNFGMGLVSLLFMALIFVGVLLVIRSVLDRDRRAESSRGRALDILDERFARGEIDQKEYEERRRILRDRSTG